jgi:hypothetical protein
VAMPGEAHPRAEEPAGADPGDSPGEEGEDPGAPSSKVSDRLERWLTGPGEKTLGGLVETFGDKSFAILFVVLLGVPALPLPTGGVTHVFEIIAALIAAQLIAGRRQIWLPKRWRRLNLAGPKRQRFVTGLVKLIRRLERISRPRLRAMFQHRFTDVVFGLIVIGGSAAAFLAPPFSGLDTLPALGVVVLAVGVLLEDFVVVLAGAVLGVTGIALEIALGNAVFHGVRTLL